MYSTPTEAESAFYVAIEQKDIDAMLNVWLDSEYIICIHPMETRLQGKEAVFKSWKQIFTSNTALRFHIKNVDRQISKKLAVHTLHEYIISSSESEETTIIETTNAYKLAEDGWRMILHHASISPKTVEERGNPIERSSPTLLH